MPWNVVNLSKRDMAQKEKIMPHLTDEEYNALDELLTNTDPKLNFNKLGPLARQDILLETLDIVARNYIITIAEATHKMPSQVIDDMVREKIANADLLGDANTVGVANI